MKVPDKVRVGGLDFDVKMPKEIDGGENIGKADVAKRKIEIEKGLSDSTTLSVLWHECIHLALIQSGRPDHEEPLVEVMEYAIYQILRDNPYLRGEHLFNPVIRVTGIGVEGEEVSEDLPLEGPIEVDP